VLIYKLHSRVSPSREGRGCTPRTCFSACREGKGCTSHTCFSPCRGGRGCTPRSYVSPCRGDTGCTPRSRLSACRGGRGCTPHNFSFPFHAGTVSLPSRLLYDGIADITRASACGYRICATTHHDCIGSLGSVRRSPTRERSFTRSEGSFDTNTGFPEKLHLSIPYV
jgi:hypothetical protein